MLRQAAQPERTSLAGVRRQAARPRWRRDGARPCCRGRRRVGSAAPASWPAGQIADATRTAAGDARKLAIGFAASAQADDQLAALGAWLGKDMPDGLAIDAELRARILFTLAARGLARREDADALPRLDPVTGEVNRETCLAMQPDLAAKEAPGPWPCPPASRSGSRRRAPPASGCRGKRS